MGVPLGHRFAFYALFMNITATFFEAFYNANDPVRATALVTELLSEDFTDHSPAFGATPDKAGFSQTVALLNRAFRQRYRVTRLLRDGDLHVGIWYSDAQHVGELMGAAPTGLTVPVEGITIYEIVDEKIRAHWEQFSVLPLLQQLGVVEFKQPVTGR